MPPSFAQSRCVDVHYPAARAGAVWFASVVGAPLEASWGRAQEAVRTGPPPLTKAAKKLCRLTV